ncbi:hypothetical protein QMK19_21045 [Streptomyces sp. H10-C2]|uniref:hypothetical protein n=1 Tax=unclassified Streptomyces TaxID=2593676 RepID=UPI0024B96441|nr:MULTISPECIES: hypothetical protein [unclassified Streptomyces]MDJ0344433.1 hypothetical protein [Streptomyces sp. PH10-H1]MDJ0372091.1 hypothetical protein [Streptomyces sp. H10-C2]
MESAMVVLDSTTAVTGPDGTITLDRDPATGRTLVVSHPFHVTERVEFRGGIRQGTWNNALVQRTAAAERTLLTVRLGRCAAAPTVLMPDQEVAKLAAAGGDPHAAILFKPPRHPDLSAYRYHWHDPLAVELAEPVLLPDKAPPSGTVGWRRFQSKPAQPPADTAALGRFFWLLYPAAPADPQYAVAVWSPNINHGTPLDALDMVVFYTPHTGAYSARYPFGITKGASPGDQAYMSLGTKYLMQEYGFAYNLAARRRQAVAVMPICKAGDWGPFTSAEGLFRLCREVALFLHRECRSSNLGLTTLGGLDRTMWLAGGSLRSPGAGVWASDFGVPPRPGRVVVSGFSTGIAPVKSVMGKWTLQGFPQRYWGCPTSPGASGGGSAEAAFGAAWQEVWDLDGFHPATGGWANYLDLLGGWYRPGGARTLRLIHSSGRVPPDPKTSDHPLFRRLRGEGVTVDRTVPATRGIGGARELHGQAWSVIELDDAYIGNDPAVGTPFLADAHHATPKVGFSHCAALSPLGVPAGN